MFRRSLAAVVVLFVVASIVVAGTFQGLCTKVEDKKIVVKNKDNKDGNYYTTTGKTEYYEGQGKDKDPKKITLDDAKKLVGEKGKFVKGETNDKDEVTKVTFGGGRKKKDN